MPPPSDFNSFIRTFDKGFVARKREAVLSVALDPNMTPVHSLIFERLLVFASPFSFKVEISNGVVVKKVELPQGSLVTSAKSLVDLVRCSRNTLFVKLKDLHNWEYILYGSLDRNGNIKYSRKSNQHQYIYIQVKDYEYHIELLGSTKIGLTDDSAKPKFGLPNGFGSTNFGLPEGLVAQNLTLGKPKFGLPKEPNSNDSRENEAPNTKRQYVNKQQQGNVVEIQSIFKRKTKTKIPAHVCKNLLLRYPPEKIIQNIKRLKFNKADNPPGYLITSLEEGWDLPVSQEEKMEAEQRVRDEQDKRWNEKLKRLQQEALSPNESIEKVGAIKSILRGVGIS